MLVGKFVCKNCTQQTDKKAGGFIYSLESEKELSTNDCSDYKEIEADFHLQ